MIELDSIHIRTFEATGLVVALVKKTAPDEGIVNVIFTTPISTVNCSYEVYMGNGLDAVLEEIGAVIQDIPGAGKPITGWKEITLDT